MSEGLKIIELKAENIKKLKAVSIKPDDNTIIISGKNGQGKSSVLDAIWYALGGSDASKGTVKPIRDGETKAFVTLDLGDLVVTRKWTANDISYLTVENKDGAVFKSPQAMLDKMIGNLSFDPLAFTNMTSKAQKDTLIGLIDLGFDLDKWEEKRNKIYDDRTDNNRKIKDLKGMLSTMPKIDAPDEEISVSAIYQEVKKAKELLEGNNVKRRMLGEIQDIYMATEREIEVLTRELTDRKEKLKETMKEHAEMKRIVETLVDPDISSIEARLSGAEEINRAVGKAMERRKAIAKLETMEKTSLDLSAGIDMLDKQKTEALQAATFPIVGLGFDEFGVTYNGIPFSQCSAAERLKVSLAMGMALNPKVQILRVTDGSLLDHESMAAIKAMVKEKDYQIWIERIEEGPGAGIYIEDGEIVQPGETS